MPVTSNPAEHRTCRRCKASEPTARFDPLARTLCRSCRTAAIEARPARFTRAPPPAPTARARPGRDEPHRAVIRSLPCAVRGIAVQDGRKPCLGVMHAHHVRAGTGGGMGMKPADAWCVPLCGLHHAELHTSGARTFEARYGVDLLGLAERLQKADPSLNPINEAR